MKKLTETQVADYVATTNSGSVQVIHQIDKNQKDKLKSTQTVDNLEEVPGTTKTLNEVSLENQDSLAVAKQVGKALAATLRDHGDQIQNISAKQCNTQGCNIIVQYGKPGDEVGANSNNPQLQNNNIEQDEFQFEYRDGVLYLVSGGDSVEICPIQNQSGTVKIQVPVAQENLKKFIDSKTPSEMGDNNEQSVEITEEVRSCFAEAVQNYKKGKNKESVKGLFRAARNFNGNTIQEKLKEAVEDYKASIAQQIVPEVPTELSAPEVPVEEVPEEQPEVSDVKTDIQTNVSFLLRLMEYVKDEVKDDDELHRIVQKIESKGSVTMDDFSDVIGASARVVPGDEPDEPKEEEPVEEYYDEDGNYVDGDGLDPDPEAWERDRYND